MHGNSQTEPGNGFQDPTSRLIVFEGMDGSGKSTLSKAVAERLSWRRLPHHRAYPSKDGEVGKLIRRGFAREVKFGDDQDDGSRDRVFGYLMIADGVDREYSLLGHLADRTTVICDRHPVVSGWVYQTTCMPVDELLAIQQREWFRAPDITFIIDVSVHTALERMHARLEANNPIFERNTEDYVDGLRIRYQAYAAMHSNDVIVLDGELSLDDLLEEVQSHLIPWEIVK
jgi:dTMP kinase